MVLKMTIHIVVLSLVSEGTEARLCRSLPKIDASTWSRYDLEFGVKFSPIHHSLASSDITPVSAAEQFATLLKGVVYPWYTHVLELSIGLGHI